MVVFNSKVPGAGFEGFIGGELAGALVVFMDSDLRCLGWETPDGGEVVEETHKRDDFAEGGGESDMFSFAGREGNASL